MAGSLGPFFLSAPWRLFILVFIVAATFLAIGCGFFPLVYHCTSGTSSCSILKHTHGKGFLRNYVFVLVLALIAGGAEAATLNVVGGQLLGASGVDVGGTLYNVEFLDGTCIDLFGGCDDVSDFLFQTSAAAVLASQALLDQVFWMVPVCSIPIPN